MGVNFSRSEEGGSGHGKPRSQYDVEYTNPALESENKTVKPKASFLDYFRKKPVAPKAKTNAQKTLAAAPVPPPATTPLASTIAQPQKGYRVVEHTTTAVAAPAMVQRAALPTPPTSQLAPKQPVATAHIIPPPPPPPKRPTAQPQFTGAPALHRTNPPPPPVAAPAKEQSMVGAPRKSAAHIAAHATEQHDAIGPVIIAKNVANLKGETTHPVAIISSGIDVNLLPEYAADGMGGASGAIRLLRVFVLALWSFSLVYAAMVGYQGYYIFRNEQAQQELTQLNRQIESYHTLQTTVTETNATLQAIQELLTQHIYWSNWLAFLEKYTLPNVYYTEFSGNSSGNMNLSAVTNDYNAVTQQINAFRSAGDVVEAVEVNTATRANATVTDTNTTSGDLIGTGLVHFTLTVQVKPDLLYYHPGQYGSTNPTD